jgi:leader peptidase (prepilin peptidase)/N-methyltransferase
MEEFEAFSIIIVSLIIGSFLNVLIYRLPLNISLLNPKRSSCPLCKCTIKWYENIPVLSYIFLKAKCSSCSAPISILYPIVEVLTVLITYILYLQLGLNQEFYFLALIVYFLIVLSFIDLKYKAVPTLLLILLTTITLSYLLTNKIENFSIYFIFAGGIITIELFVTYYIQNIKASILKDDSLKEQKAIGEGDIPIIAIIGGILGLKFGIIAIFLSAILAIIPAILNIILKKEIETPFIPFLSLGFLIT